MIGDLSYPGLATILTHPSLQPKLAPSVVINHVLVRAMIKFVSSVCSQALCPSNYNNCRVVLLSDPSLLLSLASSADSCVTSSMSSLFELVRLWLLMNPGLHHPRSLGKMQAALGEEKLRRFAGWLSTNYSTDHRNRLAEQLRCSVVDSKQSSCERGKNLPGLSSLELTPAKARKVPWPTDSTSGPNGDRFLAVLRTPGLWDEEQGSQASEIPNNWSLESSFMMPIQEPQATRVSGGNLPKETEDMKENNFCLGPLDERTVSCMTNVRDPEVEVKVVSPEPKVPDLSRTPGQSDTQLPRSHIISLVTPARIPLGKSSCLNTLHVKKLGTKGYKDKKTGKHDVHSHDKWPTDKENHNYWNTGQKPVLE